jgi:hypothetical protein
MRQDTSSLGVLGKAILPNELHALALVWLEMFDQVFLHKEMTGW